ncbi:unnamed protein product [Clonostachys chloroleuca]|uniref:Uncharacterized protein n=1 Tax=Clonostachys chloroleuca TaxID=1926264 RepID=A0AA35LV18_9HYPO|nr:unnamed protein product [Clonostachys chloroleuca]
MKAAVILSLVAAAMAGVLEVRNCAGDNCARQVTQTNNMDSGTRDGLSPIESRKADCTSFQTSTVTPDAVTTTVTVTVDSDTPAKLRRNVRAVTDVPTVVPAYASACDGSRYASACSCWGITAGVTTAPTPTSTVTTTVTQDYCEDL